jgi:hypothetical protein
MTIYQIRRIVRIHQKAERHEIEYKKLSGDPGGLSKAVRHRRKSEQLYSQVSGLIRGLASAER